MNFNSQLAFQPLAQQQEVQAERLSTLLGYLQTNSPFYKRLFRENGIDISRIRQVQALPLVPTTTKEDIQRHNWDFLCVDRSQVREFTATSGTLGQPVTIALTAGDLNRLAYNEQQSFLCTGASPDDLFQLILTLDRQFMAGMAYYAGIGNIGASVVRTGPGLPSMQWETITRLNVTSLVAVPSFLLKLIAYAKEQGMDLGSTSVKKAVCIGENLREQDFGLNALGRKIREDWNIELYSTYASTEMQTAFTECRYGCGGHEQPDLILTEILDDSGNPLGDGEYGEVTITTLGVQGMPLLRYRTGDIACFHSAPCACGRHSRRLSPLMGRKRQMIKYKGTTLYPPALFDLLNELDVVREYVVEVSKDELGGDHIKIYIDAVQQDGELLNVLRSRLRVLPVIEFVDAAFIQQMQFPAASRKQLRFIDRR